MDDLATLETRIRVLEDIEAIKRLKSKYWRCIDKKLWDELADCFTEDVFLESAPRDQSKQTVQRHGPFEIVHGMKDGQLGRSSVVTVHQGSNPDIEITSFSTAKAIWALDEHIHDIEENNVFRGWGFYEDEYCKEEVGWKIRSIRLTRLYSIFTERGRKGI